MPFFLPPEPAGPASPLDRVLPNLTIEAPHDRENGRVAEPEEPPVPVGRT